MSNKPGCEAYERGDQWFCDRCHLVWDINDDDPPDCNPVVIGVDLGKDDRTVFVETTVRHEKVGMTAIRELKHILGSDEQ